MLFGNDEYEKNFHEKDNSFHIIIASAKESPLAGRCAGRAIKHLTTKIKQIEPYFIANRM